MTVISLLPNAHIETDTVDGAVWRISASDTWIQMRDGAGTYHSDDDVYEDCATIQASTTSNRWGAISRSILTFKPVSVLPENIIMVSAFLRIQGYGKNASMVDGVPTPFANFSVVVCNSSPASNNDLVNSDFSNLGEVALSNSISWNDFNESGLNVFTFNETGLSILKAYLTTDIGIVRLGLRESTYDLSNLEPTWAYASTGYITRIQYSTSDSVGLEPELLITYNKSRKCFVQIM